MIEFVGFGLLVVLVLGAAVAGHWLVRQADRNDDATHGGNSSTGADLY